MSAGHRQSISLYASRCDQRGHEGYGYPPHTFRRLLTAYMPLVHPTVVIFEGNKGGLPPLPSIFVLVYESFHKTIRPEFHDAHFCVYVDDNDVVTPSREHVMAVVQRFDELSCVVWFHPNREKPQIYKWSSLIYKETVMWG